MEQDQVLRGDETNGNETIGNETNGHGTIGNETNGHGTIEHVSVVIAHS